MLRAPKELTERFTRAVTNLRVALGGQRMALDEARTHFQGGSLLRALEFVRAARIKAARAAEAQAELDDAVREAEDIARQARIP